MSIDTSTLTMKAGDAVTLLDVQGGGTLTLQNGSERTQQLDGVSGALPESVYALTTDSNTLKLTFDRFLYGDPKNGTPGSGGQRTTDNTLTIDASTGAATAAFGGRSNVANAEVSGNTATMSGGTLKQSVISDWMFSGALYGGYADAGRASNNTANVTGGSYDDAVAIAGGGAGSGDATGNNVKLSGGTFNDAVYVNGGGATDNASGNTVTIEGGRFVGKAHIAGGDSYDGSATGNTVILDGGTFLANANVCGGLTYGSTGTATGNTVTLGEHFTGAPGVLLYGGVTGGGGDAVTGNTLNVLGKGVTVGNVENFANLNFALPASIKKGETILSSEDVDLGTPTVAITVNGTPALDVGDEIMLISASRSMNITLASTPTFIRTGDYEFELRTEGNRLIAKRTKTYTVEPAAGINGTLVCPVTLVRHGTPLKVTCTEATPNTGYEFTRLTVSDGSSSPIDCNLNTLSCELASVTSNMTISATFSKKKYTVTATAGAGGSVDCNGVTEVEHGGSVTCTAQPNEGYEGTLSGSGCSGASCTLTDVKGNVTIGATFSKKKYTVTATAGAGGSVDCGGVTEVEHGDSVTCTATANSGYTLVKLEIKDGVNTPASCTASPCTLSGVRGNVTATATFSENGENGEIAVLSINGDTNNTNELKKIGENNDVVFTLGDSSITGTGTLTIKSVTQSGVQQKASLASDTVDIVKGEFTAGITPVKGEKTVTLEVEVGGKKYTLPTLTVVSSGSGGSPASVPTMSEIGLLLSGIALAGAAAPALRRRERKEREQREQRKRDEHATDA